MKTIDVDGHTYAGMLKNVRAAVFIYGNYDQLLVKKESRGWSAKLYYGSEESDVTEDNNVIQAKANY